ncbi:MAG: lcfB1 [Clostridia bacterium]|nr:lcfB1 [Clostridia bacterium]
MNKILEVLEQHSGDTAQKVSTDYASISYSEILQKSSYLAKEISKIEADTPNVGIYLSNSIEFIIAYFAVQIAGRICVPISELEKQQGIYDITTQADLYTIITGPHGLITLDSALKDRDREYCVVNVLEGNKTFINKGQVKSCAAENISPDEVSTILKTSGTTSNPKYVMLRHRGVIDNLKAHIASMELNKDDKSMIVLPMCFGYCHTSQLLAHIYMGASLYISSGGFNHISFLKKVNEHKVTNTTVVPSILYLLNKALEKDGLLAEENVFRYLCFGGAKPDMKVIEGLNEKLRGTTLVQTYGQTEHSPRITTMLFPKAGTLVDTVGKAIDGVEIKIADDPNNQCAHGAEGVIYVRSSSVMKGYYKNPAATAGVLRDGWLNTGDRGYLDSEGYLFISGREKNIIIRNGMNIYPEEIELCIKKVGGVAEVVVTKDYHPVYGEEPMAQIVPEAGYNQEALRASIINWCKQSLPDYKLPSKINFVSSLDKTISGKVKR